MLVVYSTSRRHPRDCKSEERANLSGGQHSLIAAGILQNIRDRSSGFSSSHLFTYHNPPIHHHRNRHRNRRLPFPHYALPSGKNIWHLTI